MNDQSLAERALLDELSYEALIGIASNSATKLGERNKPILGEMQVLNEKKYAESQTSADDIPDVGLKRDRENDSDDEAAADDDDDDDDGDGGSIVKDVKIDSDETEVSISHS